MSSPFDKPDLMVIGDSLPQGCRSLTVSSDFCSESYPAQVARLSGISFRPPLHPRPVLFDLEAIAGDLIFHGLPALLGGISQNYAAWLADFTKPAKKIYFDNLAVAGFTLEDTLGEPVQANGSTPAFGTAKLAEDEWLKKTPTLDIRKHAGLLSDLHIAVNARYVLNPGNDRTRATWSQVDWVANRQPKNLIVHIGHNNGLYAIGSRGDLEEWNKNWAGPSAPALKSYEKLMTRLARELPSTKVIVIGLPKIGAVSNLMPLGTARLPGDNEYFANYETRFPFSVPMRGDTVRQADKEIARVNDEISRMATSASSLFTYFSAYDFFARLDTKNTGETPLQVGSYTLDNNYIEGVFKRQPGRPGAGSRYQWEFERGGLQSIDGMHPTSIGYAMLAFEMHRLLNNTAIPTATRDKHLKSFLMAERLVTQFPQGLGTIRDILKKYTHPSQSIEEKEFNDCVRGISYVSA